MVVLPTQEGPCSDELWFQGLLRLISEGSLTQTETVSLLCKRVLVTVPRTGRGPCHPGKQRL